jgi:hypothetical protein
LRALKNIFNPDSAPELKLYENDQRSHRVSEGRKRSFTLCLVSNEKRKKTGLLFEISTNGTLTLKDLLGIIVQFKPFKETDAYVTYATQEYEGK